MEPKKRGPERVKIYLVAHNNNNDISIFVHRNESGSERAGSKIFMSKAPLFTCLSCTQNEIQQ